MGPKPGPGIPTPECYSKAAEYRTAAGRALPNSLDYDSF